MPLNIRDLYYHSIGPQTVFFLGHKAETQSQEDFLKKMQQSQGMIELLWMHDSEPATSISKPVTPGRPGFFHIGM